MVNSSASNPSSAFLITKLRAFFQPTLRTQTYGDLWERLRQNIFLPFPHHWVIFLIIRLMHFQRRAHGELICSLVTKPTSSRSFPSHNSRGTSCQPFSCDTRPMGSGRTSASMQSLENKEKSFILTHSHASSALMCSQMTQKLKEGWDTAGKCGSSSSRSVQMARTGSLPLSWAQTRTLLWQHTLLSKTQDQPLSPEVALTKYLHEQK